MFCRSALSTEVPLDKSQQSEDAPKPIVKIDNQHDPIATVVSIQYGNRLGELLDTVGQRDVVHATIKIDYDAVLRFLCFAKACLAAVYAYSLCSSLWALMYDNCNLAHGSVMCVMRWCRQLP